MDISVVNNKMIATAELQEKCWYDIANTAISGQMDGCNNISKLSKSGYGNVLQDNSFYSNITIDGVSCEQVVGKRVCMYGKVQEATMVSDNATVQTATFCNENQAKLYQLYRVEGDSLFEVQHNYGYLVADIAMQLLCSEDTVLREQLDSGRHYTTSVKSQLTNNKHVAEWVICFDMTNATYTNANCTKTNTLLAQAHNVYTECNKYFGMLCHLAKGTEYPLQYVNSLNCALSSYKQIELDPPFRAFFAGVNYMTPARTYYRDGYYTALAVLSHFPQLVYNQIITLTRGIVDGVCGSAVDCNGNAWWPDHQDSPMYYVMLIHAYIAQVGNSSILDEIVDDTSIRQHVLEILCNITNSLDDNYLLFRGQLDRRDWADNVYRCGYITYIQCLCYATISCGHNMLASSVDGRIESLPAVADKVKHAINSILWCEDKQCYYNYIYDDGDNRYIEDNISIDCSLAVLFGVCDNDRGRVLLNTMQGTLETVYNNAQPFGDWGTMCVWPPYKYKRHLVEKSSIPYLYHNGSDWPYFSSVYAMAKKMCGLDYSYPLTRWHDYGLEQGWFTPIEYYTATRYKGGALQGWSGVGCLLMTTDNIEKYFQINVTKKEKNV